MRGPDDHCTLCRLGHHGKNRDVKLMAILDHLDLAPRGRSLMAERGLPRPRREFDPFRPLHVKRKIQNVRLGPALCNIFQKAARYPACRSEYSGAAMLHGCTMASLT